MTGKISEENLMLRSVSVDDFEAVVQAYWRQWGEADHEPIAFSRLYAAALFEKITFGTVAYCGDVFLGLAVGHTKGDELLALGDNWESFHSIAQRLGVTQHNVLYIIDKANDRLRERAREDGRVFSTELDLLWVAPEARGLGLSKRLLTSVDNDMRRRGIDAYSLFTDNYCRYEYYCRAPWEALGEALWPCREDFEPNSRCMMFARRTGLPY